MLFYYFSLLSLACFAFFHFVLNCMSVCFCLFVCLFVCVKEFLNAYKIPFNADQKTEKKFFLQVITTRYKVSAEEFNKKVTRNWLDKGRYLRKRLFETTEKTWERYLI